MSDIDENLETNDQELDEQELAEKKASKSAADISDPAVEEMIKKMAKEIADEQLKPIKDKLDKAYKERDELATKASKAEEAARQAEIARLEEDGQELEALKLKNSDLLGRLNALEEQNTALTRDRIISDAVLSLDFRNESAKNMAIKEITDQLRQDEDGSWKHTSGISIRDFVEHYAKDEEKTFLFKPKNTSGSSTMAPGSSSNSKTIPDWVNNTPKSQWSREQMFEALEKGYLGTSIEDQMREHTLY